MEPTSQLTLNTAAKLITVERYIKTAKPIFERRPEIFSAAFLRYLLQVLSR